MGNGPKQGYQVPGPFLQNVLADCTSRALFGGIWTAFANRRLMRKPRRSNSAGAMRQGFVGLFVDRMECPKIVRPWFAGVNGPG